MTARHRLPPVPSGNGAAKLPPSVFPADPSQLNAEATRRCSNLYNEVEVVKVIAEYIQEVCDSSPLKVDQRFSNLNIVLGGTACAVGLYANLGLKFPEHKNYLWATTVLHFLALLVWSCIEYFMLSGTTLTFYSHNHILYALNVAFERSTADVTISLRPFSSPVGVDTVSVTRNLGMLFYDSGDLDCETVFQDLRSLYEEQIFVEETELSDATKPKASRISSPPSKRKSKKKA